MKSWIADGWIDFDSFQGICFDVVKDEEYGYNLHLVFLHYNSENVVDDTFTVRTSVFKQTLDEIAEIIQIMVDIELFVYLDYWFDGSIFDMEGNVTDTVNWQEDYGLFSLDAFTMFTNESRTLH
jgi:hypothetical protein